ncbi:ankyrin repeat domain-containing protein [Candidatus Dependentiae bacterium]|nr:ankyrin repeat domain-containing protein [Candidatus Dependentiae bacterium]
MCKKLFYIIIFITLSNLFGIVPQDAHEKILTSLKNLEDKSAREAVIEDYKSSMISKKKPIFPSFSEPGVVEDYLNRIVDRKNNITRYQQYLLSNLSEADIKNLNEYILKNLDGSKASKNIYELIKLLASEKKLDTKLKDSSGKTALVLLSLATKPVPETLIENIAQLLISAGADVNAVTPVVKKIQGQTYKMEVPVLISATRYGHDNLVKLLIDNHVNVNAKDPAENTALIWASRLGNKNIVELLIKAGADVNSKDDLGATALSYASYYGYKDIIQDLLKSKADVNVKTTGPILNETTTEDTPLMLASAGKTDKKDSVELLLNANADINAKNSAGYTALINATYWGHRNVADLLIRKKAELNLQDNDGETAIIWASIKGNRDIVEDLIKAGANININDHDGDTALKLAEKKGHKEIVDILKKAGATE